jgi:hypothetical protein
MRLLPVSQVPLQERDDVGPVGAKFEEHPMAVALVRRIDNISDVAPGLFQPRNWNISIAIHALTPFRMLIMYLTNDYADSSEMLLTRFRST